MLKFGAGRDRMLATIGRNVADAIESIGALGGSTNNIDPLPTLLHTMGNIMNELVFGKRYARDDPTWLYLQHLQEEGVRHIGVSGAVNFLPWLRHLPGQQRVLRFLLDGKRRTHAIYDRIVADVHAAMATTPNEGNNDIEGIDSSSIVGLFLRERLSRIRAGDRHRIDLCSDQQLRHLLADLFGAGVDTTLTTLRWLLLYVANDAAVQQRIHNEMDTNLIDARQPPTDEDRDRLPYLRATIAEAQRIRSVVPLGIPHGCTADTTIAGFRVPAGSMVIPLQWAVHMNEHSWPQADSFRPERFLDEAGGDLRTSTDGAFMPFQTGKRMCPGDELARMMLFAYAAAFLHRFQLRCAAGVNLSGEVGITLTPPAHTIEFSVRKNL